jgi:hypothetical protein
MRTVRTSSAGLTRIDVELESPRARGRDAAFCRGVQSWVGEAGTAFQLVGEDEVNEARCPAVPPRSRLSAEARVSGPFADGAAQVTSSSSRTQQEAVVGSPT